MLIFQVGRKSTGPSSTVAATHCFCPSQRPFEACFGDPASVLRHGRYFLFNDPEQSAEAGNISVEPPPADPALVPSGIVGQSEFWAMVIPKNSRNNERAWSFIKAMMAEEAVIRSALNGNGPVRPAAYDDPRVQEIVPYAAAEARSLAVAEVPIPAFDGAVEAGDMLAQTVQLVAIGQQEPAAAVRDLKAKVEALLP